MTIRSLGDARYGMFVHANIASVPGFAPVHEYADWYWSHLEPKADVLLHPTSPLPEVMAWHAEHFPGRAFDDFIPGLTGAAFDADAYAELAVAAGMRYVVPVTKHHDGFCWWGSEYTERNSVRLGPHRDVIAELAQATRAHGLVFGAYYSLLDWAHPAYPDQAGYVDAFLHPQVAELAERFQPAVLWGDGHWGHTGAHWRADQLVERYYEIASRLGFEAAVNDRFFSSHVDFTTFEYDVPASVPEGAWELCRGLAYSFCWNRAERDEDFLTPRQIVAMLVETVAKGGNLLLNIGPHADGSIPAIQERVLREAGEWVRANDDAINGSAPFVFPGIGSHWYTITPGDGLPTLNAIDLEAAAAPMFAALGTGAGRVGAVLAPDGSAPRFEQTAAGLRIHGREQPATTLAVRYRIQWEPAAAGPIAVTPVAAPGPVHLHGATMPTITAALQAATPGDTVELAAGRYGDDRETFPLVVPAGVTLRAVPGVATREVVIDAGGKHAVSLAGDGATLAGVTVVGGAPGYMMIPPTCVSISGASNAEVRECVVESISVTGGDGHRIHGNVVAGGNIWCMFASSTEIVANYQTGLRWGPGIEVRGGEHHLIAENECRDDLCAIRVANAADVRVEHNRYETRWFGIHVDASRGVVVRRNQAWRTMRAASVEGGAGVLVERNLAEHCDTGALIERDATDVVVSDNWFHDCRVGVLCWDDGDGGRTTVVRDNAISEPRDHAIVYNRDVTLEANDLGTGDIFRVPERET